MNKYKQFILGVLTGTTLFSGAVFAANELNIKLNSYPVLINGTKANVEAYNIDDYTYLKLADVGKALGSKVVFNQVDNQIEITTVTQGVYEEAKAEVVEIDIKSLSPQEQKYHKNVPKTSDGLPIVYIDNDQYIPISFISEKYNEKDVCRYDIEIRENNMSLRKVDLVQIAAEYKTLKDKNISANVISKSFSKMHELRKGSLLLDNIQYIDQKSDGRYIPYDYYIQNILPLLK